jgi:hypothetical protein
MAPYSSIGAQLARSSERPSLQAVYREDEN